MTPEERCEQLTDRLTAQRERVYGTIWALPDDVVLTPDTIVALLSSTFHDVTTMLQRAVPQLIREAVAEERAA